MRCNCRWEVILLLSNLDRNSPARHNLFIPLSDRYIRHYGIQDVSTFGIVAVNYPVRRINSLVLCCCYTVSGRTDIITEFTLKVSAYYVQWIYHFHVDRSTVVIVFQLILESVSYDRVLGCGGQL
ncbi:hypothetical protein D3C87_1865290 [compost metagenome]